MMAEEKKASAVFGELGGMMSGGLVRARADNEAVVRAAIDELRDVEDEVMVMSPGVARNRMLALLRNLRDDVMDELVVSDA